MKKLLFVFLIISQNILADDIKINEIIDYDIVKNSENFRAEIRYFSLYSFTFMPFTVEYLKNNAYEILVEIKGNSIFAIIEFLNNIENEELEIINNSHINARVNVDIYLNEEIIFSYAIDSFGTNMIINGKCVKNNKLFYDFINDYLPKKIIEEHNEAIKWLEENKKK